MITFDHIKHEYKIALEECTAVLPLKRWAIEPQGIGITNHKTKYGLATYKGIVLIGEILIGTNAITSLRNTLRHELAHLAVGLNHKHDRVFKRCAAAFNANLPVSKEEIREIDANISYKWMLVAYMDDGTVKKLGGAHRKTRVYTEYPRNGRRMTVDGELVSRFEFEAC